MTPNDNELLQRYLQDRSEAAFAELVRRHIDLVHSSALRQVNGDTHAAQDVVQAVFVDLSRKAARLTRHVSLTGWLYTSTRFLAANVRRAAQRRMVREQTALIMNELSRTDEAQPDWSALQPVLDAAMHELGEADREAVLWRYFERRPFADIARQLGVKENTVRMRVERALEKLRAALLRRGISSTGAALAALLTAQAVTATPSGMAQQVSQTAVAAGVGTGGLVAWLAILWASTKIKVAAGAGVAALVLVALVLWPGAEPQPKRDPMLSETSGLEAGQSGAGAPGLGPTAPDTSRESQPAPLLAGQNLLLIRVVSAEDNKPAAVDLRCYAYVEKDLTDKKLRSNADGTAQIAYPTNTTSLQIMVTREGFADTRLEWQPSRGEVIPAEYILRMATPVTMSGWVTDAEGWPVKDAVVTLHMADGSIDAPRPESHTAWVETSTDATGRWQSSRVASELVRGLRIYAGHSEHAESPAVRVATDAAIERQLREGTFTLRLGAAGTLRGLVVDPDGNPVAKAKVQIGPLNFSSSKTLRTAADGTFEARGCAPGKILVTADAKGFAATAVEAEVGDPTPVRIELSRGKSLLVKTIDRSGSPVAGVGVGVGPARESSGFQKGAPQFSLTGKTGADGAVFLPHVPQTDLDIGIWATGYMEAYTTVSSNDSEVIITLAPALIVSGRVRDATDGELIPKFTMAAGRPEPRGPFWSTVDRLNLTFEGGVFRFVFEESVVHDRTNSGYLLKFEAEGYAPYISRHIAADEGTVHLEVALQPAKARQITVLNPDGRPAALADVGFPELAKRNPLILVPGGFDVSGVRTDGARVKTDQSGKFKISSAETIRRAIAANSIGYADVNTEKLTDGGVIQLQAWGRVEGRMVDFDQPPLQREVIFLFHNNHMPDEGIWIDLHTGFRVKPDANGRFVLPLAPPGRHGLYEMFALGGGQGWGYRRKLEIEVVSGRTTQATFTNAVTNTARNQVR